MSGNGHSPRVLLERNLVATQLPLSVDVEEVLTASAGRSYELASTNAYNALKQRFFDEVLERGLTVVRGRHGWTSSPAEAIDSWAVRDPAMSTFEVDGVRTWLFDTWKVVKHVTYYQDGTWECLAAGERLDRVNRALDRMSKILPQAVLEPVSGGMRVRFWSLGPFGPTAVNRTLAAGTWAETAGNYPAAIREQLETMMAMTEPAGGRLALWHGPPGTGKTHAIRSLVEGWQSWCDVDYIVDPDEFFGTANYMVSVLLSGDDYADGAGRWRLIVLEDSGEWVRGDARGQGLGRLLNLADGMVGQGLQQMVLMTTNEPIEELHAALTRPGRCMSNIRFDPFTTEEAVAWLAAHGVQEGDGSEVEGTWSLAELYNALSDRPVQ